MEENSPDLTEIQVGQRSASSHVVDEQLGGYDAGNNPQEAQNREKTPEQYKEELVSSVLEQNKQLEGQFLTEVSIGDDEKVYIFNVFPYASGDIHFSAGVSSQDGPVLFTALASNAMARLRISGESFGSDLVSDAKSSLREGDLPDWQKAFTRAKEIAGRSAERIRSEKTVLPKALEFVRSQVQSTEAPSNLGGHPSPGP